MCGFAPTVSAIIACRDLGATEGRLVRYANSRECQRRLQQRSGIRRTCHRLTPALN